MIMKKISSTKTLLLASSLCLGSQLMQAETVLLDFGSNAAGLGVGIDSAFASGSGTSNPVFTFDLSSVSGFSSGDYLEVDVTGTQTTAAAGIVYVAGNHGLAVQGGSSNDWFDTGETLDFVFAVKDASNNDITNSLTTFDFTGFSMRANSSENPDPTVTIAGQSLTRTSGNLQPEGITFSAVDMSSIAYSFQATRSGESTAALQLGQLQFDIVAVPEPSSYALLGGCFALAWVMVRRRRS